MSKTVIIDHLANTLQSGSFNNVKRPLDYDQITQYQNEGDDIKNEFFGFVKPMLAKGGFLFDKNLWSWYYTRPNPYELQLWARLTWTDDNNEGKTAFMNYIKQTGLLDHTHKILKSYS